MVREVVSIVGSRLDQGLKPSRWQRWRPTVALCQQEDWVVDRLRLLVSPGDAALADVIERDIASVSPETRVFRHVLEIGDPWDFEQTYAALHDFAELYRQPEDDVELLIHITTGTHAAQICLFLLTESRRLPGKLLQGSPLADGPRNWAGSIRIIDLDLSKYDRLASRFALEQQEGLSLLKSGIQTCSQEFNRLVEQLDQVAISSDAPILLMGPTGAGKTQLARRIYELKRRRHRIEGPFVEVNCATLRGDQVMSALFGHVQGAFTGASQDRGGLLRAADGGMLFLDEVGELGRDEQAMLLRAIEDGRYLPVGADREQASCFHLIAGTNQDLLHAVRAGCFREDLFTRINLWTFRLPGLSQRREDIEPNLDYELQRFAESTGSQVSLSKEARRRFLRFAKSEQAIWSGSFRDLNAAVIRMATLARGGRITEAHVEHEMTRLQSLWRQEEEPSSREMLPTILSAAQLSEIDLFDRAQLETVLRVCRKSPSLSEAGRRLFTASRRKKTSANDADRLRKYLARFQLSWREIQG